MAGIPRWVDKRNCTTLSGMAPSESHRALKSHSRTTKDEHKKNSLRQLCGKEANGGKCEPIVATIRAFEKCSSCIGLNKIGQFIEHKVASISTTALSICTEILM